ncbi:MAG: KilA-N domain-containing protein [Lachnospiraceae bacterium]|nr:KilA-N domain-containing protein [Lachnospiraceae bacterium]MDD7627257.1 KilA-N domain-containing protein [Lachnospiraceae bacterium]MDY4119140.1 KilA-N domain-containing protein [Lachnospiraceae bacterium]
MAKIVKDTIHANGIDISVYSEDLQNDYISLTDIAKKREGEYPGYVIQNWLRNKSTVAFVGLWELIHNPNFNCVEFEAIKNEAGLNSFVLTPKRWVETTNAIGIVTKAGRYAETYAHKDIAFEFASWISPEFKLYIIEDYQRLKEGENARLSLGWNLNRELSKLNYRIHTDAVKVNLIPPMLTPQQISYTYASEADLLNTVLFGKTAKEWRDSNLEEKGNIRDHATIHQLLVLANMESYNVILIKQGKNQDERMQLLHELAVQQMTTLSSLELSNLPGIEKK